MIIREEDFTEFNDAKAFASLMHVLTTRCCKRFNDQIGTRQGWHSESSMSEGDLAAGILKHSKRIKESDYDANDLFDLIVYTAMLWNITHDRER